MTVQPKFTPKYWVGHDSRTNDAYIETMYKHRADTYDAMVRLFGEDWEDQSHLEINLIEMSIVLNEV